ncbi:MAG: hypothetical protein LBK73_06905 [Treponema sp.]|jgi:hypothetical protein|nr:hypothetical protein [Treponema sp.]
MNFPRQGGRGAAARVRQKTDGEAQATLSSARPSPDALLRILHPDEYTGGISQYGESAMCGSAAG